MLFFATGYPTFWNCYSQYSRFKLYLHDKTGTLLADHKISKSRDRSLEFSCRYAPRVHRLRSCSLTHLIPTRITRVSQNRKNFLTSDGESETSCKLDGSEPKLSGPPVYFIKWRLSFVTYWKIIKKSIFWSPTPLILCCLGTSDSQYSTGGHASVPWVTSISPTGLSTKNTDVNFSTTLQNRYALKTFLTSRQQIRKGFTWISKTALSPSSILKFNVSRKVSPIQAIAIFYY